MDPKVLASQLRMPEGELGIYIGNVMNKGNAHMYRLTLEMAELKDNERVLEIGFGNGMFTKEILEKAKNITYCGVDFSPTMVLEAKKFIELEKLSSQAYVQEAGVSRIPFADNTFDKIFTINTLYFWPEPKNDVKEIFRVLKPGGTFCLGFRPKAMVEKLEFTKYGFRLYDLEEAQELVISAGFKGIHAKYQEEEVADFNGTQVTFSSLCIQALK